MDVIIEEPNYDDFCGFKPMPVRPLQKEIECPSFAEATSAQVKSCKGMIEYSYDQSGCPTSFECNTCNVLFDAAGKQHRLIGFLISSIMGVIAVIVGMYVKSKQEVIEWIYSGILIGGIISIFIGTMSYFRDMGRYVKPFVILAEMALIIWIAIRTSTKNKKK